MLSDLPGRLSNLRLPASRPLLPLFEAVINSLQAIQAGRGSTNGRIDVHVKRAASQRALALEDAALPRVSGFAVTDNGTGFENDNYRSFETTDSTFKRTIGGKGIGRLLWLKAFREARVNSVFRDGAQVTERTFTFRASQSGIEEHRVRPLSSARSLGTTVELLDMLAPYTEQCPQSARVISERLIEHLMVTFLLPSRPTIVVHDELAEEHIDVIALYEEHFAKGVESVPLSLAGSEFVCHLARMYNSEERRHRYFLCANEREVTAENLNVYLPDLTRPLHDGDRRFVLLAYVTGEYLDSHVNQERTSIAFADPEETLLDEIRKADLVRAIVVAAKNNVEPFLTAIRTEKRASIEKYVASQAPEFRPLLKSKYAHLIDQIPPHLTDDRLDAALHEQAYKVERTVLAEVQKIRSVEIKSPSDLEALKQRYATLIDDENELGKAKLVKYVIHRKAILELFERQLALQQSGGYSLEESIHDIICPLRTTSEDVPAERLNLWIIDERLAFHYYLASDKALSTTAVADIDGAARPDLVVFNRPIAFVDSSPPFQSVVLVEFKRPMRTDFDKDPIKQVYQYARTIAAGEALDRSGRPIAVKGVPFYAYLICDITPEVRDACREAALVETPDGTGYFGFNTNYNTYIEVLSFGQVLENSKRRNRVFFERLGIPTSMS